MKLLPLLVVGLLVANSALASPFPPSSRCTLRLQLVRPLGKMSTLHAELRSKPEKERPFQCASQSDMDVYKCQAVRTKVVARLAPQGSEGASCPEVGRSLEICHAGTAPRGTFTAEIESRGDECFAGYFLEKILN